ncbi:ABC transporter permease, partial [Streptomyces sp. NPDC012935]
MTQALHTPPRTAEAPPGTDLAALAARHGLSVSGARPTLPQYVRQLWARRHFITAFSTAKLTAQYSQAKLGQVWQVLTPLLNAAVYYLIFGKLMGTSRGVPDFVPFLVTGVFVWTFTQSSIMAGTRAISGNLGLVRALHFPRAALPISFCLQQLQQLLFSMAALVVILLCFGVPVAASWLLALPALVLQFTFNAGVSLVVARMGARTPDIAQLMPFLLRTWMYASGVMF